MGKGWLERFVGSTAAAACVALATSACEEELPRQQPVGGTGLAPNEVDATVSVSGDTIAAGVRSGSPDETVAFAPDLRVTLEGPSGSPPIDLTGGFEVEGDGGVRLAPFEVTKPGKYEIVLAASGGAMVLGNKAAGTDLRIGTVRLGFERLPDGTMLVPTSARLSLPTAGSTAGKGATFEGLPPRTKVTAAVRTQSGTVLSKSARVPDGAGSVTIADVGSGIDVSLLDGDHSMLAVATSAE